ncbi:HAD family hydrolase [Streptosporangium minutum]|uniref:HAD family hydrolase n=1 Tax=Streptosporangium minutum TaxID=569862 RepID=UPI001F61AAA1|nr:HAD-IA family hydrolase [Streptosporangium minutum]
MLFDLDNALVNLDEAFQVWTAEFVDEHRLGPEAVDWLIALDQAGYPHREAFFGMVRKHFALPESVEELWGRYRKRMPYLVHCRPGVMDGLTLLRAAGWKVAIVTNGTADNQLGKIQQTGLAEAVDAYALSGLEGIRKPDVGLFEIAAKRCGMILADGGWMVGDHPVADIGGGRAAGLCMVWIDRGTWPDREHEVDHVVTDVLRFSLRSSDQTGGRKTRTADLANADANNRSGRTWTTMDRETP